MSEFEVDNAFDVVARGLPAAGIDVLLIGGHAVNHYGYTRATQDVDFMIVTDDAPAVRKIMLAAGFTNVSEHETVLFFNRPGSPLRLDFLRVVPETMQALLAQAVEIAYRGGHCVKVPQLRDLIAMKIFALSKGPPQRMDKDLPDIVNLAIAHHWSPEGDLQPLCDRYGTPALYDLLKTRIQERTHA